MIGNVHSIETFGTVDGPGIRYVIFLQGCLMRCQYCHNADSWEIGIGKTMTIDEIIQDFQSYLPFIESSGGGITVSGGEALLQIDFVTELFRRCKELGIHTTIDTSGGCFSKSDLFQEKLNKLLKLTDIVLLDLKHIDRKKHMNLTGMPNDHILQFARHLSNQHISVWIRHVLVPGITDAQDDLLKLGEFIRTLTNVEKVEILPYHKLGVYKWKSLGLSYPLEGVKIPTEEEVENAYALIAN